ncbi:cupin domain-containing protein [Bartonella sp. HY329]|uniref:cupin domain-containing protein n=1 Tax=unclassified Bartonella TaxID=2645622 RepID=UPI0021C6ED34|nr:MULTISPECIES: cupin domain-containing protein [unclassified Bartonella]UXM95281.1 cupin domain-containing protein [Bartonella sp. HY329]UXN09605.1 cupin domain-containing protein [Bartonella sp. HY328]
MNFKSILFAAIAALTFSTSAWALNPGEKIEQNFNQPIPNVPGKSLIALEVSYEPGAETAPHSHPNSSFIYAYVVSGEIESQVNGGEVRIYKAGESWSEAPGSNHQISRNASKTKPAKLLAVFVVDSDEKSLVNEMKH